MLVIWNQIRANTTAPIKANLMTELLSVQMSWENGGCTHPGSHGDEQTRDFGSRHARRSRAMMRANAWGHDTLNTQYRKILNHLMPALCKSRCLDRVRYKTNQYGTYKTEIMLQWRNCYWRWHLGLCVGSPWNSRQFMPLCGHRLFRPNSTLLKHCIICICLLYPGKEIRH